MSWVMPVVEIGKKLLILAILHQVLPVVISQSMDLVPVVNHVVEVLTVP